MTDNRNTILAVILSGLVLIAWQYFYNVPQMERQRALQQTQAELVKPTQTTPGATPPGAPPAPAANSPGLHSSRGCARYRHRRGTAHQDQHATRQRQHFP